MNTKGIWHIWQCRTNKCAKRPVKSFWTRGIPIGIGVPCSDGHRPGSSHLNPSLQILLLTTHHGLWPIRVITQHRWISRADQSTFCRAPERPKHCHPQCLSRVKREDEASLCSGCHDSLGNDQKQWPDSTFKMSLRSSLDADRQ